MFPRVFFVLQETGMAVPLTSLTTTTSVGMISPAVESKESKQNQNCELR